MSFGLRTFKKADQAKRERTFKRHLVVGDDLFALKRYLDLVEKYGESEVGLLGEGSETEWSLRPFGPTRVRGEEALKLAQRIFPEGNFSLGQDEAQFFKEGSFRSFQSRSKSEPLLPGEEFFVEPPLVGLEDFVPKLSEEELARARAGLITVAIKEIAKLVPEDLVENAHWAFIGMNGVSFECEHAHFALSPQRFLTLFNDKNELSDEFIEYCEKHQTPAELGLRFVCEKLDQEHKGTLFLPLSYTHPWGHFIGETRGRSTDGLVELDFIHFFDPHEVNEEEVGRKIRLLKRQLEKIYPDFSKKMREEFVFLKDHSPCLKFDDGKFTKNESFLEKFEFVSVEAPLGSLWRKKYSFEDSLVVVAGELRALAANQFA